MRITLLTTGSDAPGSQLWSTTSPMPASPCRIVDPGPPFIDRSLAGRFVAAPRVLQYESDALTAHLQAMLRELPAHGFSLTTPGNVTYVFPAELVLYYYR
jgi:hypothetical protein